MRLRDFTRHLYSQMFAIILTLFVYVMYQSVWPHSPPITVGVENVRVTSDSYGVRLQWDCKTKIYRQFNGHLHRQINKRDGSESVILPSANFSLSPTDKQAPVKSLAIPGNLSSGEWCVKTTMEWYEAFSLRESRLQTGEVCFLIPQHSPATLTELIGKVQAIERELTTHVITDFTEHSQMKGPK